MYFNPQSDNEDSIHKYSFNEQEAQGLEPKQ